MFTKGDRVRLAVDYPIHSSPGLKAGIEGVVFGQTRKGRNDYLRVDFPGAGRRDIAAGHLTGAAGTVARAAAQTPAPAAKTAAQAKAPAPAASEPRPAKAVLEVGPRGGYRSLTYEEEGELQTLSTKKAIDTQLERLRAGNAVIEEKKSS